MRKQEERPSHELWSFARYLNKVFDFRSASDRLTDSRHQPEISAPAVFRAVFYGLVFRLASFQQLQSDIAQPAFQRWIGVERAFGDDVLRYSLPAALTCPHWKPCWSRSIGLCSATKAWTQDEYKAVS